MSIYLLVSTINHGSKIRIGDLVAWKETPFNGSKEGLPNWVTVHATDATIEDAHKYLNPVRHMFTYNKLAENENGKRLKIQLDGRIIAVYGAEFRVELYEYLQDVYNAQVVPLESDPPFFYVLDFPFGYNSNNPDLNLQILKGDFEDKAVQTLDKNRYYFSVDDVQAAIDAGGGMELTRLQVHTRLLDKLDG